MTAINHDGTVILDGRGYRPSEVEFNPVLNVFVPRVSSGVSDGRCNSPAPAVQPVPPRQYELYAECIRSGQMPDHVAQEILRDDLVFAAWYRGQSEPLLAGRVAA